MSNSGFGGGGFNRNNNPFGGSGFGSGGFGGKVAAALVATSLIHLQIEVVVEEG